MCVPTHTAHPSQAPCTTSRAMPGGDADCSCDAAPATLPPPLRHADGRPAPPPREAPKFTIGDLRAAVPAHCFKRSAVTGGVCARAFRRAC